MSGAAANPLEQSDEDFLNQSSPPEDDTSGAEEEKPVVEGDPDDDKADPNVNDEAAGGDIEEGAGSDDGSGDPATDAEDDKASAAGGEGTDGDPDPDADADGADKGNVTDDGKKEEGTKDKKDDPSGSEKEGSSNFVVPTEFSANGKTVKLKSEAEALQLMQMGANYTKRMQDLAPHRKTLLMLQNNEIDENKLSFLIDLDKKNPEAIKKLIQDANIDPMDIDTSIAPDYIPGNHKVTDEQERFRTAVDEVTSLPNGKETILTVTKWDQASKDAAWKSPELIQTIHQQRELGVYDLIADEIDRRTSLGQIPVGTPFLEAYKTVGMEMAEEANRANGIEGSAEPGVTDPAKANAEKSVVTTRVAEPKSSVANGDKAKAASPSKATPSTAKAVVNVLAQDDGEFLKQWEGRV